MTRPLTATQRRSNQLVSPGNLTKATRSFQKTMTGFMVDAALAPLDALTPTKSRSRKAAAPKAGRTLGAALKQLRAVQSLVPGASAGSTGPGGSPRIRKDAQYLALTHRSTAGSRGYKLYLPASEPIHPKGLILMLHGCSQTPDDFAVGTHMNALAEKHGLAIVYPAQTTVDNAASCWNWFKLGDQFGSAGEPALLASLTRKLMKDFGLGRDATFVAGLSAGGAMAAILTDVYPDLFSAAGVHSGLARGAAHDVVSAMLVMRSGGAPDGIAPAIKPGSSTVRRIVFHGDSDHTVHPSNASMIVIAAVGDVAVPIRTGKRTVRGRGYARSDYLGSAGVVQL